MSRTKGTEVAKAENTLPAALMEDLQNDANMGMENVDADSVAIPIISILQKMSPQVDPDNNAYIDGAKAGMLYNTATGEIYEPGSLEFIPALYERVFIEWVPRNEGGGLVNVFTVDQSKQIGTERNEKGHDVITQPGNTGATVGNELADTRQFYGFVLDKDSGDYFPAMISMTYSQIKKAKRLMSIITGFKMDGANGKFTPPMFFHRFTLDTCTEENKRNESYKNWALARCGDVGEMPYLYTAAKDFGEQIRKGAAKADYASTEEGAGDSKGEFDDDVAF